MSNILGLGVAQQVKNSSSPPSPTIMELFFINSGATGVSDPLLASDWNTFFGTSDVSSVAQNNVSGFTLTLDNENGPNLSDTWLNNSDIVSYYSNTIQSWGSSTFKGTTALTHVNALSAFTIGSFAFNGATAITSINLEGMTGWTSTNAQFANGATSLTDVTFGALGSGSYIPGSAFQFCSALNNITYLNSCNENITTIYGSGFQDCDVLTDFIYPNVTTLSADYIFYHCYDMTNVDLRGVTSGAGANNWVGITGQNISFSGNTYLSGLTPIINFRAANTVTWYDF